MWKVNKLPAKIIISVDMYTFNTFLFTQKVILLQLYKCGVCNYAPETKGITLCSTQEYTLVPCACLFV
jgi:hypothetical protein